MWGTAGGDVLSGRATCAGAQLAQPALVFLRAEFVKKLKRLLLFEAMNLTGRGNVPASLSIECLG